MIVVVLIVVVIVGVTIVSQINPRKTEPDPRALQREWQQDLRLRLSDLYDHDCRDLCLWMADSNREYQQVLYDALAARDAKKTGQNDNGQEGPDVERSEDS